MSTRWKRLCIYGAIILAVMSQNLRAQRAPYAFPARSSPVLESKIRMTHTGRTVMDLGNYDVVFSDPLNERMDLPLNSPSDELIEYRKSLRGLPQVIYNGDTGIRWGGGIYLEHPAHHHELVTQHYLANRVLGRGDERYPLVGQQQTKVTQKPPRNRLEKDLSSLLDRQQIRSPQLCESECTDVVRVPKKTIPNRLPDTNQSALATFRKNYPFAVQFRPDFVRSEIPRTRGRIPEFDHTQRPEPRALVSAQPPLITIVNADSDVCSFTLLGSGKRYPIKILGGQSREFKEDGDWLIRFDSQGMGTKTYRIHGGNKYRFSKSKSDVWELRRLPASPTTLPAPGASSRR